MDSTSLANRERRRKAAASRRTARSGNDGGTPGRSKYRDADDGHAQQTPERPPPQQQWQRQRQPLETNLLSSLSQALNIIDQHNNDFSDRPGGGEGIGSSTNGYDSETITFSTPNNKASIGHDSERKSKYSKLPPPPSQFSSYYKFSRISLYFLLAFMACYLLVLICCYPMISYSNADVLPTDDDFVKGGKHHIKRGASFQHIRGRKNFIRASHAVTDKLGTLKERAVRWEEEAKRGALELQETEKELIDSIAGGTIGRRGGADARRAGLLLERAVNDFDGQVLEAEREEDKKKGTGGHDHWKDAVEAWDKEFVRKRDTMAIALDNAHEGKAPGFMVLGMHRSGTSMLSGLLVKGYGYETGGPLIGASFDNEKGFYERIDVVLQNDEFMYAQNAGWSWNVNEYDPQKALEHKQQGRITFKEGKTALKFLNNHMKTKPYLQKDPRMCITLPTWLKLLDDKPAILFTYRHPLEVAMSLKHRENNFSLEHGLRLWIVYNMKALQNSNGLCRVFSTNEAIFKDPMDELPRIMNELTHKCNVIPPPIHVLSEDLVDTFIDPKLQHNKKEKKAKEKEQRILKNFGPDQAGKECLARDFESDYKEGSANRKAEVELYLMAMKVYCDLEGGPAFTEDYEWPDLAHWQRPVATQQV